MTKRNLLITNDEIARIDRWADELVERVKAKLISPPEREYEFFIDQLADFVRRRKGDFTVMTQVIEAADKDDPVAHGVLDRLFREQLDVGQMPTASLREYHRRASNAPKRGRFCYEDYGRNIGFMDMVRVACQAHGLQPTRNRASRRRGHPCGCSVISAALKRTRIDVLDVAEGRLANLWGQQGKIAILMVDAWQAKNLNVPK